MRKKPIVLLCMLIAWGCLAAGSADCAPYVLVADFYGDGELGDVGAALAAACRTALGPASIPVQAAMQAMRDLGLDPARGLVIDSRNAEAIMGRTGARLLVTGRLVVSPAEILLALRFINDRGTTLVLDAETVSSWQGWPGFARNVVRDVTQRAKVKTYPEPPEAMRPCLESYGRAVRARWAGNWEQALRWLGRAQGQNPAMTRYLEESAELNRYLELRATDNREKAQLLLESGRAREAAALLAPQATKKKGNADLQRLYGTALLESGMPEKAVQALSTAAQMAPESSPLRIALAQAQAKAGRKQEAEASLRALTGSDPRDPDASLALADILHDDGRVLEAGPIHVAAARALALQGRMDDANGALIKAMAEDPSQIERIENLDPDYLTQAQARALQSEILGKSALDPETRQGLYARGMLLPRQGSDAEAEKALSGYLATTPENGPANREMGRMLASRNKYKDALGHWEKAATARPAPEILLSLTQVYQAQGKHDKALQTIEKLVAESGGAHLQALTARSVSLLETGNPTAAKLPLNQVLEVQSDDAVAHRLMARIYAASGWDEGAQLEMKKAAMLDPEGILIRGSGLAAAVEEDGVVEVPVVPNSEKLAEALELLFQSFDVLKNLPDAARKEVWVGIDVQGLDRQPFYSIRLWNADLFAQDAAWVLGHRMEYRKLLSLRRAPVPLSYKDRDETVSEMIAMGMTLDILLVVRAGEGEGLEIEGVLYRAADGGQWANSVFLDSIGLSPLKRLNILLMELVFAPMALALLAGLAFFLRGWGTLIVEEEHDPSMGMGLVENTPTHRLEAHDPHARREFFSVLISRKKLGPPLRKGDEQNYLETVVAHGRQLSRYSACLVGKKTVFRRLPARSYYVYFYGVIADMKVPIGSYSLEKTVRVRRNREETVTFDLRPKEATIHVQTFFQGQPCYGAEVWVNDKRTLSVYTKDESNGGAALIRLPKGEHTIHAAFEDLLVSRALTIEELSTQVVFLELTDRQPRAC